jgi:RHS repeat-associated protein
MSTAYTYVSPGVINVADDTGAVTELRFTSTGQIQRITDPLGRVTEFAYDVNDYLSRIEAPGNTVYQFSYDAQGRLLSQTDPLNQTIGFTYGATGDAVLSVTDQQGRVMQYGYDANGKLTQITYPDGLSETFAYNASGQLVEARERSGDVFQYGYDAAGRLTRKTFDDNTFEAYVYDAKGNLTSVTDVRGGITAMVYDAKDRLTKITYPTGRSLEYAYDSEGRRTQMKDQTGFTVNYAYDAQGRLLGLKNGANESIVTYAYDVTGRLSRETNGNGTYTTYSYDSAGQLLKIGNYKADGTANSVFEYTYDNLGRQATAKTPDGTWSYTYDATGQLTEANFVSTNTQIPNQSLSYVYDAAGNRTQTVINGVTTNYTINNLNQYTTVGTATHTYDADGNLISVVDGTRSWTYTYNDENRLIRVVAPEGTWDYEYDPFGNRTASTLNGQRTEYLVDPFGLGNVVGEYGDNGLVADYVHGIGLVGRFNGSNTGYYDSDFVGSTVGLTNTTGSYINRYAYRPFGENLLTTEGVTNPFEYVGQWGVMDEAHGIDFMRARFYSSQDGRFIQKDPIGLLGGDTNLYRYVGNQSIALVDPTGLACNNPTDFVDDFVRDLQNLTQLLPELVSNMLALGKTLISIFPANPSFAIAALNLQLLSDFAAAKSEETFQDMFEGALKRPAKDKLKEMLPSKWQEQIGVLDRIRKIRDLWRKLKEVSQNADDLNPPAEDCPDDDNQSKPKSESRTSSNAAQNAAGTAARGKLDPLVLDLDGDGIELVSIEDSTVQFDLNADGFTDQTGWVKGDDGLLALDENQNGRIDDIRELFGDATTDGFIELKTLDSNNDNLINARDAKFAELRIWQDFNQNGITDPGELNPLAQLNISSISLTTTSSNVTNQGNLIRSIGKYTLANGTEREAVSLWFAVDRLNTTYAQPYQLKTETLFLPTVRGYGKLPDLYISMSLDSQLLGLMREFVSIQPQNLDQVYGKVEQILFRWAGVDGIDPTSRGQFFDARKLKFLETFLQQDLNFNFRNDRQPLFIRQSWDIIVRAVSARLLAQGTLRELFPNTTYNLNTDTLVTEGNLTAALERLQANAPTNPANLPLYWSYAVAILDAHENNFNLTASAYDNQIKAALIPSGLSNHLNALRDLIFGSSNNDTIYGDVWRGSFLVGESGDDTLTHLPLLGANANDIFYGGAGNDIIPEAVGIDWVIGGAGNDVIIKADFSNASNAITINTLTNPAIVLSTGAQIIDVERFFTVTTGSGNDNITMTNLTDNLWIFGGAGNDLIASGSGQEYLKGGEGDDILLGGAGNESGLAFFPGWGLWLESGLFGEAGNDQLFGEAGNDYLNGGDGNDLLDGGEGDDYLDPGIGIETIIGGAGFDTFRVDLSSIVTNLTVNYATTSAGTISNGSTFREVELLVLVTGNGNDNITITATAGDNAIFANGGNDTVITGEGRDRIEGGDGDDTLQGGAGNESGAIYPGYWTDAGLWGGAGNDQLFGEAGNDYLNGGDGNDLLDGGEGDDYLDPGVGIETIIGGAGFDTLRLNLSSVISNLTVNYTTVINGTVSNGTTFREIEVFDLATGSGNDNITLTAAIGDSAIYALAGNDTVLGGAGRDRIEGGDGDDTLRGGAGSDSEAIYPGYWTYAGLLGGAGNDQLFGDAGNDYLGGDDGNDSLNGGSGDDELVGGGGADWFIFDAGTAFTTAALGIDRITDFTLNIDKIVLGKTTFAVLTSPATSPLSASEFATINETTNGATIAGASSARIVFNRANGSLFYNPDGATAGLTGGGQFATLTGVTSLSASDFLFRA